MAKRVDPLKAKQARQKKIAAVGGVLLLGLLGIQGPKTLKMLQGPQPVASATSAPTTTTTGGPTAGPGVAPVATGAPPAAADLASVADSDAAPVAEPGQLATFERFSSKDPFAQQGAPVRQPAPAGVPNDGTTPSASGGAPTPAPTPEDDPAAEPAADGTGGFTTGSGGAPAGPALAEATTIAVNGVAEDVAVEASFPKDEPTFVLVSIAENGTSVELGIAGGQYADGGATMTLGLGKTITLQNTADGSRYELELRSIQGFPLPKKKS